MIWWSFSGSHSTRRRRLGPTTCFRIRKVDCEMEGSSSADLPESIFFTARKARVRSNTQEYASSSSQPASSSRDIYSARIGSIMERKSELSMSQEDAEIEASKEHWTVVEPDYFTASTRIGCDSSSSESVSVSCSEALAESDTLALYEENLKEMQRLQEENPESRFFEIGDDGIVLGRKIAEGGQAGIYEVQGYRYAGENWHRYEEGFRAVLKVFKAGYSLRDFQKQWPLALLHKFSPINVALRQKFSPINDGDVSPKWNPMLSGRLLGDGRFAFEMLRCWGDLRKLLDVRMEHNGNCHPPFMMPDGNYHECCMLTIIYDIANGMRHLHREGTLHRDLKASNVLIFSSQYIKGFQFDPILLGHDMGCLVTDYECSIGVVGTGYWRAPEILEALKNRRMGTTNLFTQETDVYSFAMTCYEVLTGCIPFEEVGDCNGEALVDDVLGGRRPTLLSHLQPWVVELINRCWHIDPFRRPTFEKICDVLQGIYEIDLRCQSESIFFKVHKERK